MSRKGNNTPSPSITKRKRMEQALLRSKDSLKVIFDTIQLGILVIDADTHEIVDANPSAIESIGTTKEKIVGNICHKFICPAEKSKCPITDLGQTVDKSERVLLNASGQRIPIIKTVKTMIASGQKYLVESFLDITSLKQAQEEYKTIIETAIDGFWLVDMQGRFLDVNDAYCQLIGYSREELLKMGIPDVEAIEAPEETTARIAKITKVGGDRFESRHRCKDGRIIDVEVSVNYIEVGGGRMFVFIRDITERKRMEETLRENEEKLRLMFESAGEAITVSDLNGKILEVNQALARMHGYNRKEELIGRSIFDFIASEDHAKVRRSRRGRLETGISGAIEYTLLRKDGSKFPAEVNGAVIRDVSGNAIGYIAIAVDITERKQAEEKLQESESRYRDLFENAHDMVQSVAPDGHLIFVNQAWLETLGYTEAELPNLNLFHIIHPDSLSHCQELFAKIMAGESVRNVEATFVAKDGRAIQVEGNASARRVSGKVVATHGIFRDVTKRKRMEEALRQSEQRFRDVSENALEWIWEVDANGKYTYSSPFIEKILGYKPEEILKKHFYDLFHPEERQQLKQAAFEVFARKEPFREFVNRNVHKNGDIVWLSTSGVPILDEKGELVGYRGADIDITERRQIEDLYRTLTENLPIGVYIVQEGKFVFVNPQFQKDVGFTEDELLGTTSLSTVHPEDQQSVREETVKRLKGKVSSPYEFRTITKNGETRVVMETMASIQYKGKRAALGSHIDITEHRRLEEQLQESEKRYRTLHELSPQAIVTLDMKGVITSCNPAVLTLTGYAEDEIVGKHFTKLPYLRVKDVPKYVKMFGSLLRGSAPESLEIAYHHKTGTPHWVEARVGLLKENDRTVGVQIVFIDITERKRAEQELQKKNKQLDAQNEELRATHEELKKFKTISDEAGYGVVMSDLTGNISYINGPFARMHGYTPEKLINKHLSIFHNKAQMENVNRLLKQLREKDKFVAEEVWHIRKDGTEFPTSMNGTLVRDESGTPMFMAATAIDITRRKQVEEALRFSDAALKSIHDGVIAFDTEFIVTYWNEMCEQMFGIKASEAIGKYIADVIQMMEDYPGQKQERLKLLTTRGWNREEQLWHSPRGDIWVDAHAQAIEANGKRYGWVTLVADITERKKAEEALANEATRRRILVEQSRDGIVVLDQEGKVYEANQRFAEMLRYSREEMLRLSVWDWEFLFPPEKVLEMIQTVDETGDHFETQHRRKDGTIYDVEISTNAAVFGRQKLIFCVCRDITERKRAEQLQRDENTVLTLLGQGAELSELLDAIVRLGESHDPSMKGSLLLFDSSKGLLFPASASSLPEDYTALMKDGLPIGPGMGSCGTAAHLRERVIVPDIQNSPLFKPYEEVVKCATNNGLLSCWSEPIISSDGELLGTIANYSNKVGEPSADSLRVLEWSGRIAAIAIERKRAEKELQEKNEQLDAQNTELRATEEELRSAKEKLEERVKERTAELEAANEELKAAQEQLVRSERLAAIGQLAGGVGHELRNPLGAIKNAVYYVRGKVAKSELGQTEPRVMDFLSIIDDEINSSNKIINDLLNFSRVGKPAVSPARIERVIDDAIAHTSIPENIELTKKLDAGLPEVEIDADQIRQVLVNIVTNAVQAMSKGGKLTLAASQKDKFLEVKVTDTGHGVPEEIIGKIFDPLFTTKAKGIGLGLAVCKSIIDRHGGHIEVESEAGKGTTFTIKLPLKAE